MKAFNHFASLIVVTYLVGAIIGTLLPPSSSMPIAILAGIVIGFNWHKVTGYKLTIGGNDNER
jgi:hypothetical protein